MRFLLLFFITVSVSCNGQSSRKGIVAEKNVKTGLINYHIPFDRITDSLKLKKNRARILVSKSKYLLTIKIDTIVVKNYPVVFGFNPIDDKLREGDGCTPEGKFKIKAMYAHKSWSKFIWFDYPNETSWVKHNQAKKKGIIPGQSRIGGDVGIHGVPKGADYAIDQRQNWTLGCVSLKNKDIAEIYKLAFIGMTVEIEK